MKNTLQNRFAARRPQSNTQTNSTETTMVEELPDIRTIINELLRESERNEGRPLEDVLGNYNGRRSERRLAW